MNYSLHIIKYSYSDEPGKIYTYESTRGSVKKSKDNLFESIEKKFHHLVKIHKIVKG